MKQKCIRNFWYIYYMYQKLFGIAKAYRQARWSVANVVFIDLTFVGRRTAFASNKNQDVREQTRPHRPPSWWESSVGEKSIQFDHPQTSVVVEPSFTAREVLQQLRHHEQSSWSSSRNSSSGSRRRGSHRSHCPRCRISLWRLRHPYRH